MVTDDLRLAILDWSLVGHLSKPDQVRLSQILDRRGDAGRRARSRQAITGLAEGGIDGDALRRVVEEKLALIRQGALPGVGWLMDLMDDALIEARGRFGSSLVIFRKVLQTLKGVVADVSEESRADVVLASSLVSLLSVGNAEPHDRAAAVAGIHLASVERRSDAPVAVVAADRVAILACVCGYLHRSGHSIG